MIKKVCFGVLLLIIFSGPYAEALEIDKLYTNRGIKSGAYDIKVSYQTDVNFDSAVLLITGPTAKATVWQKEKNFGMWLNGKSYTIDYYNSVSHIYSSAPIAQITSKYNQALLNINNISDAANNKLYQHFINQQRKSKLFYEEVSDFEYSANILSKAITLPANIPTGEYKAYIYLFKDKNLVLASQNAFHIKNTSFLYNLKWLATRHPLLYSMLAILLAFAIGAKSAIIMPIIKQRRRKNKK